MKKIAEIINCIWAAFSMYSRIPVPAAKWDKEGLRWQICCFPLVGAVIGIVWSGAGILLARAGVHPVLSGAILTALPVLLTGGIHMDGFLDTTDALHSWKSPEERLKILDDPHVGAFALIYGVLYFMVYFGLCAQLADLARTPSGFSGGSFPGPAGAFVAAAPCFILCRVLSGLSVIYFPKAKKDGMLKAASEASDRDAGRVLIIELVLTAVMTGALAFACGRPELILLPVPAGLVFAGYYRMSRKNFGGVSGDQAGWFLETCEITLLAAAVLAALIRAHF